MKVTPLTVEEIAASGGFTHRLDFNYRDIGSGIANNTAKTWGAGFLPALAISDWIAKSELHLTTKFANTGDPAYNTTTISFGDVTTATRFVNASEGNLNGSNVLDVVPGAVTNAIYTVAGQLQLQLGTMTNKSLSNLNAGAAYILFEHHRAGGKPSENAPPWGTGNV